MVNQPPEDSTPRVAFGSVGADSTPRLRLRGGDPERAAQDALFAASRPLRSMPPPPRRATDDHKYKGITVNPTKDPGHPHEA